ncbi:MAG: site-specific DNA-methyltransferase [Phycisphaerales bacterium]|nr:site-specific DNA-methyltransferase [Phycisphaerales bacterium]
MQSGEAERGRAGAVVVRGDWLEVVRGGFDGVVGPASVDMVYADVPFNTGVVKKSPPGGKKVGRVVDAAYGDALGSTGEFVAWLRERLEATKPLLKRSANVLIHCDWRTSHRVRVMLDEVFGEDRFVNHLIWSYGLGGSSPRRFARKHDDVLVYCVEPGEAYFEPPRVRATSNRLKGRTKKATDVLEIPSLNNMAKERTGYPTQKPLELLEMLVVACSPAGGVVVDPCCGSGTTLVAAVKHGRLAVGCDVSEKAVRLSRERALAAVRG